MGKKVKKPQQVQQKPQEDQEMQEEEVINKEPLEKWLPFNKYVNKATKNLIRKKKQAINFIKLDKHQINNAVDSLK